MSDTDRAAARDVNATTTQVEYTPRYPMLERVLAVLADSGPMPILALVSRCMPTFDRGKQGLVRKAIRAGEQDGHIQRDADGRLMLAQRTSEQIRDEAREAYVASLTEGELRKTLEKLWHCDPGIASERTHLTDLYESCEKALLNDAMHTMTTS